MANKRQGYRGQFTDADGVVWDIHDTGAGTRKPLDEGAPSRLWVLATQEAKHPGGRPRIEADYFWLEVIAIANTLDGLQGMSQADMRRRMETWCREKLANPPSDSWIRDRVKMIWNHLGLG